MGLGSRLGKVLIANRGEIACRVIKSARRLGVKTVAVYSDIDSNAMHVAMADEAYNIGRPPPLESYLKGTKIIEVAKSCNARAIHPGYGFLSESTEFATLCSKEGIVFIGPPPSAIRDMGIKSTSKAIMSAAGVPVIPGYHGDDQSNETLIAEAKKIGFPLMIKAVRGGGGKGMRIARSEEEFLDALDSARRESLKAFNDSVVLLEKYVARPRHIEVQIFGDTHGNHVHLFERDCSVQRRHQKVIEQAPAPGLDEKLRQELGEAGVRAAKAVNYVGAGTVEFIMDTDTSKFYFMEMNTRLQVEHPVTEMITGVDLVEWQLRAASGEKLPLSQDEIKMSGHAVEARIYAEDVPGGFMPTAGHLHELLTPVNFPNTRVEIGIRKGDDVSVHYDPMIAKLVTWDSSPEEALDKLDQALQRFNIVGVENNVDFLRRLCRNSNLREGNVHTGFIEEHKADLLFSKPSTESIIQASLGVILNDELASSESAVRKSNVLDPFVTLPAFRLNSSLTRNLNFHFLDQSFQSKVIFEEGSYKIQVNEGDIITVKPQAVRENNFISLSLETPGKIIKCRVAFKDDVVYIFSEEGDFKFRLENKLLESRSSTGAQQNQAVSPMPGVVEKILVQSGTEVKKGDPIAVVMAMKMEHVIKAARDGKVSSVLFKAGDNVGKNVPLVTFEDQ